MPIYEYTCTECNHQWEQEQKITSDPEKTCPNCKKESAKRLISGGTGFILNGAGWAKDSYSSSK